MSQVAKRYDVVAFGSVTRELLVETTRFPAAGDALRGSSYWTCGGMAGNLAHTVARLGGNAAMVCAIGDDPAGDAIVEQFAGVGVEMSYLYRRAGLPSPSVVLIVNPQRQRAGLVLDEAVQYTFRPEDAPDELLLAGRVFFTDMTPPQASIAISQRCRSLGVPVAFDLQMAGAHVNLPGWDEHLARMFKLADYFFADQENFLLWRGAYDLEAALQAAMQEHPECTFVITRGAAGSLIAQGEQHIGIPAFPVEMVDSIGAGDAYHGAFLYAYLALGWSLERAGRLGSAVAALSCRKPGARDGLPALEEALAFLQARSLPTSPGP